jgi:hypothetical protein
MSPSRRKRTDGGARRKHGSVEDRFDPAALAQRAKDGSITPGELEDVARHLRNRESSDQLETLIFILGYAGAVSYQPLIEAILDHSRDWKMRWQALSTLVSKWGVDSSAVRAALHQFLSGVPWDEDEQLRTLAISCAGQVLQKSDDRELALWLLRYARMEVDVRPDSSAVDEWFDPTYWTKLREDLRDFAVESLARALGHSWQEILPLPALRSQARAEWYERITNEASKRWLTRRRA